MIHSGSMKHLCLLLIAMGFLLQCGGDDSPTTPSSVTPTTTTTSIPANFAVTGRLTNAVTGEPIRAARLEIPGVATTETGGDGSFEMNLQSMSEFPLIVEAEGYWRRETHIHTRSQSELQLDIIPDADRFDLDFFDHVFRDIGRSSTRRWITEPEFEIWTKVFDCLETDQGFCEKMVALEQDATLRFVNLTRDVVSTDSSKLTGGAILGSNITTFSHSAGTILSDSDSFNDSDLVAREKVTIVMVQLPSDFGSAAQYWYYPSRETIAGHIQISKRHHKSERGVISHELAHVLGYSHKSGGQNVPMPSIMRYGHAAEPTRNDILHGRILYKRPPGSRTPDKDPENYFLNALRDIQGPRGRLMRATVRN